jgi:uncharacterized membrane protein YcaP (DUF421 family)
MEWFEIDKDQVIGIIISTIVVYIGILVLVRMNGLRSFSKMTSHDFATTIAVGSIFGTVIMQKEPSAVQGLVAIAMLLLIQSLYSLWRMNRPYNFTENTPLLLYNRSGFHDKNLQKARLSKSDIYAKMREANVDNVEDVNAVVFETSGNISILHGHTEFDGKILDGVREKY